MDNLVERLSNNQQNPVILEPRIFQIEEVKNRLENGFILIKFTNTKGGTELGITLESTINNLDQISKNEQIKIVGSCELNCHKVRCIANIDLETRKGTGYLEVL